MNHVTENPAIENVATATPVEIDTLCAALWQDRYHEQTKAEQRWHGVKSHITEVLRSTGAITGWRSAATEPQIREWLAEHADISEDSDLQEEAYGPLYVVREAQRAWAAYLDHEAHAAKADEILYDQIQPLDEEYERRGRWNRAFLVVTNGSGHVHRTMNCPTCRPTTRFHWVTEFSDHTEAEIVAAAGERACSATSCFPSAPVGVKGTAMFTPDEQRKQEEKATRDAKKAAQKDAEITVVNWQDGNRLADRVFKTQRGLTNALAQILSDLTWYGESHPSATEWLWNLQEGRKVAEKGGWDYDKALANARKKTTREGGTSKF